MMGMAMLNADPRNARSAAEDGIRDGFTSPDIQRDDRRRLIASPFAVDGDDWAAEVGAIFSVFDRIDVEPVAVRGDRLTLVRLRCVREPDFASSWLALYEYDEQGRLAHEIDFDEGDLAAALAELDRSYFFGEGAPHQRLLTICDKFGSVSLRDDTAELADFVAPEFEFVDHRLLGYGEGDRQYLLDVGYNGLDRVDGSVVNRVLYPVGSALLAVQRWLAISETGSEFEQITCFVLHVDESGLIDRLDLYDEADCAAAFARVDELGAQTAPARRAAKIENAATRADARAAELIARGDDAALAGSALADGFVLEDRRSVVALPDLDARGLAENFAAMRAQGYTIQTPEPLAVRGDRLCLSRRVATTEGGDESPVLALTELDEQGHYRSVVFFDADDLSAAMTELDDRYLADEGARHARVLRVCHAFGDANERRDFDAMREMLSADFVMSDHTRLGYGEGDREYFDAASRTMADVAPSDGTAINRLLCVESDALLTVREGHHITAEGSDYAWVSCIVVQVDPDDRIQRRRVLRRGRLRRCDGAAARARRCRCAKPARGERDDAVDGTVRRARHRPPLRPAPRAVRRRLRPCGPPHGRLGTGGERTGRVRHCVRILVRGRLRPRVDRADRGAR